MKSKLNFLIGVSLNKKLKTKWFIIANIVVLLLIIGIINIDSIIKLFGGDFENKTKIYVIDETNEVSEKFKQTLEYYSESLYGNENDNYEVVDATIDEQEINNLIKTKEKESILIKIYFNEQNDIAAKLVSLGTIDTYNYQLINTALSIVSNSYLLNSLGLSEEQINKINSGVIIERKILDENIKSEDENMEMIATTVIPTLTLPFLMLTILLIQFVGAEINDEKTTKSMEIIISNVSPKIHFVSKIISNNLFIIIQLLLMIVYVVLGFGLRKLLGGDLILNGLGAEVSAIIYSITTGAMAGKLLISIILAVILVMLTFVAFSFLAAVLASMTTNIEDYQQIQTPMAIIVSLGIYLSLMSSMFKGSLFIKILSYIPLISSVLSPSLLVLGQIGIIDVAISILIMIITNYILIKYGIRIYKVGILNYSSGGMWKKIFKSLKSK